MMLNVCYCVVTVFFDLSCIFRHMPLKIQIDCHLKSSLMLDSTISLLHPGVGKAMPEPPCIDAY